jgi:hypothetical protein
MRANRQHVEEVCDDVLLAFRRLYAGLLILRATFRFRAGTRAAGLFLARSEQAALVSGSPLWFKKFLSEIKLSDQCAATCEF